MLILLCISLTACGGGGGGGTTPVHNKTPYQIWLDEGHTGSEQDYLDSLISGNTTDVPSRYVSVSQIAQIRGWPVTHMSWPNHGDFNRIEYAGIDNYDTPYQGNNSESITYIVYNEKELNLVNYGVVMQNSSSNKEFSTVTDANNYKDYYALINNREGVNKNVYTPNEGTVFKGGALAYAHEGDILSTGTPLFIKGDAEYVYSTTNPKLTLDFENYYTFVFETGNKVTVSGTNDTEMNKYDINTGNILLDSDGYSYKHPLDADPVEGEISGPVQNFGFVKKGAVEEMVGTYRFKIDHGYTPNTWSMAITGAFGGTKQ